MSRAANKISTFIHLLKICFLITKLATCEDEWFIWIPYIIEGQNLFFFIEVSKTEFEYSSG
jgi:hypothetical protein